MAGRRGVILGWMAVAMCCLIAAGCRGEKPAEVKAAGGGGAQEETAEAAFVKMGPADAAIEIVAFYPQNESHQFIVDYLKEFAAAHPEQVSLEVIDHFTPEGAKRWRATGLSCAGVFVNGSTQHEIERDGETETVNFIKRMGVFWTREDFETVVNKLLEEAGAAEETAEEGKPEA